MGKCVLNGVVNGDIGWWTGVMGHLAVMGEGNGYILFNYFFVLKFLVVMITREYILTCT